MESVYAEAKPICINAILDFKWYINDHLADGFGKYIIDWNMSEAEYVGEQIDDVISIILSTVMRDHVTYELTDVQRKYHHALKNKNIEMCKKCLNDAVNELNTVGIVLSRCKFKCC